jgi:hypothetical protein
MTRSPLIQISVPQPQGGQIVEHEVAPAKQGVRDAAQPEVPALQRFLHFQAIGELQEFPAMGQPEPLEAQTVRQHGETAQGTCPSPIKARGALPGPRQWAARRSKAKPASQPSQLSMDRG